VTRHNGAGGVGVVGQIEQTAPVVTVTEHAISPQACQRVRTLAVQVQQAQAALETYLLALREQAGIAPEILSEFVEFDPGAGVIRVKEIAS
jgi:hypothetical protein